MDNAMKLERLQILRRVGLIVLGAGWLAWPARVSPQAPPGPLTGTPPPGASAPAPAPKREAPAPPPRQTILGAWKLNRDESDTPHRRSDEGGSNNGGYGGRRSGGGWPGGGGGYPGGGGRGGYGGPRESDEERQKMHELTTPPSSLALSMTGAEVDLVDDQDRKRAFMTDGRKLQKSKDPKYEEIAARWDGTRLVSDEKSPRGGKMSRTFELSPDGRQLYETLRMEGGGRNSRSVDLRFVYDLPVLPSR